MKFLEQTYEEILAYMQTDRIIAVITCEGIEFVNSGTRSERVVLSTRIVAPASAAVLNKPFVLTRFSQNNPIMKVGQTYLIAAYKGEWAPAWCLVEALSVDSASASEALHSAITEFDRRATKQRSERNKQ
ncbi:MAG: hypothetical protein PHF56_15715 [Desulfuromonadaceae bacterium]|nr:hypothetical protein [Desulfuromonadaceae bacterium]